MTNKLFIGGLSFSTTQPVLVEELNKYGTVELVRLICDPVTGKSKGFAFVTYSTVAQAQEAINALDNKTFDGRIIGVKPAVDRRKMNEN